MTVGEFVDKYGELRSLEIMITHHDESAVTDVPVEEVEVEVDSETGKPYLLISPNDPWVKG